MLLIKNFLELDVVTSSGHKLASCEHAVTLLPRLCHERAMNLPCVNQTRPHCVNQMGKTQSKALAERHGRGMAWERHGMCESALRAMAIAKILRVFVNKITFHISFQKWNIFKI
jgi:hypothetical protein